MELTRLLIFIAVTTAIGWSVTGFIMRPGRIFLPEKLSIAYGIGIGCVTLEMLILSLMKVRFSISAILAPWVPVLIAGMFFYKRNTAPGIHLNPEKSTSKYLNIFLVSGIALEVFYTFFRALIKPLESYDAVAIYAIKSKIFYLSHSVSENFLASISRTFPHPDYPINIPLCETLSYIFMGNLNDQLVKLIFPIFYVAILVLVYYAIRRFASRTYSLIFTFILASPAQFNAFAANGYLEVPLAYYSSAGLIFLFMWFENRKEFSFLVISAVMTAMSAWTKNEGILYCAVSMILLAWFLMDNGRKIKEIAAYFVFYTIVIAAINMPWFAVKKIYGLVNSDVGAISFAPKELLAQISKIPVILYGYQREFFGPKKWNIFWPVLFVIFAFYIKKAFSGVDKYITASILLAVAGYTFIYMTGKVEAKFFVTTTWSRFLIHFFPVAVYWLARMLKDDVKV